MDYRNADGSVSEMCGNGVRLFARYLVEHEGVDPSGRCRSGPGPGPRCVTFDGDGCQRRHGRGRGARRDQGRRRRAIVARAARVDGQPARGRVRRLARRRRVAARPARSTTRRSTPTGSTSSSSCAAATGTSRCGCTSAARARPARAARGRARRWSRPRSPTAGPGRRSCGDVRVDVPGGRLAVTWTAQRRVVLTGPAVIVAHGEVDPDALRGKTGSRPHVSRGQWTDCQRSRPGNPSGRTERSYGGHDTRTRVRTRGLHTRRRDRRDRGVARTRPRRVPRTESQDSSGRLRPRRAARAAARRRPVDRARGHHRGRVPPAPPGAGDARRRLDRGHRGGRRELDGRARAARRDGRLTGARRALPAPQTAPTRRPTSAAARSRGCARSCRPPAPTR